MCTHGTTCDGLTATTLNPHRLVMDTVPILTRIRCLLETLAPGHLPMELKVDLATHQVELLVDGFFAPEISAELGEGGTSSFDLAPFDQFTWRLWHKGQKPANKNNPPGDLDAEGNPPLDGAVGGVAAGETAPVGQEVSKSDAAASEAADQAAVGRRRNLTEVDGNGRGEAT